MKRAKKSSTAQAVGRSGRTGCWAKRDPWNRCQVCGKFIPYADFENGKAINDMVTPDSDLSSESWDTRCRVHYTPNPGVLPPAAPTGRERRVVQIQNKEK